MARRRSPGGRLEPVDDRPPESEPAGPTSLNFTRGLVTNTGSSPVCVVSPAAGGLQISSVTPSGNRPSLLNAGTARAPGRHDLRASLPRSLSRGSSTTWCRLAAELIGAHYAAIGVLAPDGRLMESFTTYGIDSELRASIGPPPRGHGILGLVDPRGQTHPAAGSHRAPRLLRVSPAPPEMRSFLGVPIVGRRGVFGNLYLTEKRAAALFTEEDEYIAILLASRSRPRSRTCRPRGERPAAGGSPATPSRPRALLRDGQPRAP